MNPKYAVLLLMFVASDGMTDCYNSSTPSCNVYPSCFAKYCPCSGDDDYFLNYGYKYCSAFLQNMNFSNEGKKWRDKTLLCLQESIVPKLDISNNPTCNCKEMKSFAFSSHVTCYTSKAASICDLPLSDVNKIRQTIAIKDAFTSEGWKQMQAVSEICASNAPNDGRRTIWNAFYEILKAR